MALQAISISQTSTLGDELGGEAHCVRQVHEERETEAKGVSFSGGLDDGSPVNKYRRIERSGSMRV